MTGSWQKRERDITLDATQRLHTPLEVNITVHEADTQRGTGRCYVLGTMAGRPRSLEVQPRRFILAWLSLERVCITFDHLHFSPKILVKFHWLDSHAVAITSNFSVSLCLFRRLSVVLDHGGWSARSVLSPGCGTCIHCCSTLSDYSSLLVNWTNNELMIRPNLTEG